MKKYFRIPKKLIAFLLMLVLVISAAPVAFAQSFSAYVSATDMPVYSSAAMTKRLGYLPVYTVVKVLDFNGDLGSPVKISYNGNTGYALPKYMQSISDDATKATINANTKVYLKYKDATSGVSVKQGTEVTVVLVKDGVALIERSGIGGFIETKYLGIKGMSPDEFTGKATATPAPDTSNAIPATVVVASTTVHAGKTNKTKYLGTIKKGTQVNVIEYGATWAYIELNGNYGYCDITALKKTSDLATPTPAAIPAPKYSNSVLAQVLAEKLPIYAEKSESSKVLATMTEGSMLYVVERYEGTLWCKVELNGNVGYCEKIWDLKTASEPITVTPAPAAKPDLSKAIPATVVAASTTVHEGKTNKTKYLGTIKKGTQVNVIEYGATWAYIELNGNYGYCDITALKKTADLATPTPAPKYPNSVSAAVLVDKLPVYADRSESSKVLGTVTKGDMLYVVEYYEGYTWCKVELNGNVGYCDIFGLKVSSDPVTVTPAPTATPTPDTSNAIPATVVVASTTVHAGKTNKTKYLGTIKKGTQVNVIDYGSTWAYIELNGNYGYCAITALKKTADLATPAPTPDLSKAIPGMAIANVKVYQSASTSSKYLGTLKAGKTVNVIDSNDTWAYIELSGNYGYCAVSALIPMLTVEEAAKAVVSADKLDFYAAPSTAAKHIGRLSKGAQLNVLTVMDGWAYVEYKGNYGWCKISGLIATEAVTPTPTADPMSGWTKEKFVATVVTGSAQVWAGPGTGGTQNVALGTNLTVVAYNTKTGWAAVEYGKVTAYIKISDLSRSEFATLTNGSSGSAVSTLEKALLSMGYFDEIPDSTYNSATVEAVKLFQSACGMSASGNADAATQRVLFSGNAPSSSLLSSSLAKGASGASVTRLQRRLYYLGYLSKTSSVDGDYGTNTYNAVGLFQQNNGLAATGTADRPTLAKLYSTGAAALPSDKRAGDEINIVNPTTGTQTNNSTSISSTLKSTTSSLPSGASAAEKIEYMIYVAQNQLGKPYVYGASGTSSYDCSGFTVYCFKQIGVSLPRTAQSQGYSTAYSRITNISDLKRGDLVYFNTVSDSDSCDHAGIYLGAGWFIHASSGQAKVVISNLASNYYNRVFSWGHRPVG